MSFSKAIRFRAAENIVRAGVNPRFETAPNDLRLVHSRFEPLLIHRPMRHYQRSLCLTPGNRANPPHDFLSEVLGHHRGHDAILRDALGESLFKSLQNLRNGSHDLTETTLKRIAQKLRVSREDLARLEGHPERVILGYFSGINFWHEFIPNVYTLLHSEYNSMAQHRADRNSAACQWWQKECRGLESPECIFLDRLLTIAIGIVMLSMHVSGKPPAFWFSSASPSEMSQPDRHPMGNWLWKMCSANGFDNLNQWCKQKTADFEITYEKLRKWSAGTQCMPLHQGMLLVGTMYIDDDDIETGLTSQHLVSRLLSLAQEFIAAAAPLPMSRETNRRLIHERLNRMETQMRKASLEVRRVTLDSFFSRMKDC